MAAIFISCLIALGTGDFKGGLVGRGPLSRVILIDALFA